MDTKSWYLHWVLFHFQLNHLVNRLRPCTCLKSQWSVPLLSWPMVRRRIQIWKLNFYLSIEALKRSVWLGVKICPVCIKGPSFSLIGSTYPYSLFALFLYIFVLLLLLLLLLSFLNFSVFIILKHIRIFQVPTVIIPNNPFKILLCWVPKNV